jgi:hypothetical protein
LASLQCSADWSFERHSSLLISEGEELPQATD